MSRCFPYPPPGYTLSKASNDALIESIKLQQEKKKKAKAEKKERKKSKKEKKEKKEKNKRKEEKPQPKDINISHEVYGIFQKVGKEEIGQWERSGITEELGLPCNSQDPSNSSDSTQNSNKRKRHESPINGGHIGGNILRFRLPSQKQMDCKTSSEVEFHRTTRIIDLLNKNDSVGTSRVSMPTNSTTVQLILDSTTVDLRSEESSKAPVDSITVKLLPGESSKTSMNSKTCKLRPGEVSKTPMNSTTIQLFPSESSKAPMNSNTVQLLPGEPSKAPMKSNTVELLPGESSKVPMNSNIVKLLPGESSKASMESNTVELLHGESSKAPNLSAVQQNGVILKEKHCDHVSKKSKKQHKDAKKYEKMIDHIPLRHADETMDYEEDWLCRKNLPEPEVKVQTHNQISCASICLLWPPRAQYMHEADLYSLPYSIPF